ncbi:deoxyribodipyrimidine photolyase [Aquitalea magnusonii]|nr:deoxyribodipyrimidine photolyase [Aquitalea magnusonii]
MTTLRLILGDQLNPQHSWFASHDANVVYLLLELRQETGYVLHHAQKLLAVLAGMRDFARQLKAAGHRVRYVAIDDPSNRGTLEDNLDALCQHYQATEFAWQAPDEWRLDQQLQQWANRQSIPCRMVDSEHFYTTRHEAGQLFAGKAQWRMEVFYRQMRKRHRVLLQPDGKPVGGEWNYDHDNRKPWRGSPPPPQDTRPGHDHQALWHTLQAAGVQSFGNPAADALRWPLNRTEALQQLHHFIRHGLPQFGDYQDAMHSETPYLFHSLLSFALNTKMLSPREVVAAAEQAWQDGLAPLPAVEGFIRQILGWREYVRGVYWARMPGYADSNAFDHQRPLPEWFWHGKTGMRCLAHAIGQSLQLAYAHHIQRLMVIGNFSLLAGLSPQALHEWYLGVYIDAFEWVELPNTVGMSQFADGGLLASKPYVSGNAYLHRMGNYCGDCRYRRDARHGADACPFNALYWDFFQRQRPRLGNNPRLALVYRQLDKMPATEQEAIRHSAAAILQGLNQL